MFLDANLHALAQSGFNPLVSKLRALKAGGGGVVLEFEPENRLDPIRQASFRYPFIMLYGAGDAGLLKNLAAHYGRIFVFESALEFLLKSLEIEDFSQEITAGKIYFLDLFGADLERDLSFLLDQHYEYLDLYELFIASSFYERHFYEHLLACDLLCKKVITHLKSARGLWARDILFSTYKNFLSNVPTLLRHIPIKRIISQRHAAFETALIAAAGPSLDENLALLKAHQEKFVIFCTDGALKALLSEGIRPDYVLNADIDFTARDFLSTACEALFICGYSTHPKTLKSLENQPLSVVLGTDPACALPFLEDFGFLELGSNVAHFAYTLAIKLGFKRLIMLGQDLALSADGASHTASYALGSGAEAGCDIEYFKVKGVGGGEVMTHTTWNFYLKMLENLIALHPQISFINASSGAAIAGSMERDFRVCCEDLSAQKPRFPAPERLTDKQAQKLLQKFRAKIKADLDGGLQILDEAEELLAALKRLLERDLSQVPPALLSKFFELVLRFDEKISQDAPINDGKLSPVLIQKGAFLKNALKIQNDEAFLRAFLLAYRDWLGLFRTELDAKLKSAQGLF
ncbi:6-hydroxymethylpterin diphosphokinase MptE-like protein [Campylobacter sp.]|uniref:motility associated factor glycosyltransferase family protein n=1 Tax=Campylobacter sp. TaxID=205 RepID=UPI0026DB1855|nr:6-hydroxymethylpterin diphosphokinase MptE-like protein [Campylobacter sp.]MDO4674765.1 DUF115 domain-containing protein [Campylobacter sp.]